MVNRKVIIAEGYLAAGKSTFARRLSAELGIPYLMKDTFKSALCAKIPIEDRKMSSLFSAVTFDAIVYGTERLFEVGFPVILEGNFAPFGVKETDEAGTLRELIGRYGYSALDFKFCGDTRVLYERFMERENTPERGQANRIGAAISLETFDRWCHGLDSFDVGGEVIRVDTTELETVDFDSYIRAARRFLEQG